MAVICHVFSTGVWRNGSASDFDCLSLSEGCSFEYCHAQLFLLLLLSPVTALKQELRGLGPTSELITHFPPWLHSSFVIYLHRG